MNPATDSQLLTSSVLIPTFGRPASLRNCLESLTRQLHRPDQVLVVWQADDVESRNVVREFQNSDRLSVQDLHLEQPGIVPAENLALQNANGEIIVLIDDDAVATPDWLARHLQFYQDPSVGAVGGPADNFSSAGPFPKRAVEPVGRIHWTGKISGNMYDQIDQWRLRPPEDVDHLVGYNFSLRRNAFDKFDENLRRYWQLFELDACLQVRSRGYRVVFDYANVVDHYPTNTAYSGGREGDLQVKVLNGLFNRGYIFSKHFSARHRKLAYCYQIFVGNLSGPGVLASCLATWRFGNYFREMRLLRDSIVAFQEGWTLGSRSRSTPHR
ncbi:glycosyltransferase family 2 protein [Blastopirellula marina]|uniref:Glycosyl transferase, family 2 n=1 Tax=Blastopirellula marina DSM 3645 TaxID=314230 RepID=A3ZP90_9BACT|nr:glycosyltransferase family 2 protein [Blastopirellula marina]EAQ81568.1 Glycosyl transferase, family 2 [Blastopirellula marina DSM 3645]